MAEETISPARVGSGSNGRRRRIIAALAVVFLLVGIGYAIYWYGWAQYVETTDDAYVGGNVVAVTPQISGTVTAIEADETDLVRQGQILVRLDGTDTAIALAQAKANLADTVRRVRQMFQSADQRRADVAARAADVARAKEDLVRRQDLIAAHAVSAEELAHARTAYETATSALQAARYALAAAAAMVGGTDVAHHPMVKGAEASLRRAYVDWRRTVVLAPVTGYVANRSVQLGERVNPGMSLMTVVPLNNLWVDANLKEGQFTNIRIGQPVTMTTDLYGSSVVFHGRVVGISAGTGAAFALLPPQNATGNWIKIVQRLPVRVSLEASDVAAHPLRIGLSMNVSIDTRNRRGEVLARTPVRRVRYDTPVYGSYATQADAMIRAIVGPDRARTAPDR